MSDYIAKANEALEARARAFEARKAVEESDIESGEKRSKLEAIDADIDRLGGEAEQHVRSAEREAEFRALSARLSGLEQSGGPARPSEPTESDQFRSLAVGEVRELAFDLREARVATVGTSNNAGTTTQNTFVASVVEAMRERSPFFGLANVVTTGSGETIEWPVKLTRPTAAQVAENTAYSTSDETWGRTSVGAFKYGVMVQATEEIVSDSRLDILSILGTDAGEAVADDVVEDLLTGTGTTKPWGWATRATGSVNAANLAGVTFDNLIDLSYAIKSPYRRNAVYMFNDTAIKTLRKVKDTTGQYLWQPALTAGAPDMINGYPVLTDPNMPIAGASAKVGLFGDPKKYLIRQAKDLRVVRSDEYGFDKDLITFKVTWRGSGDLLDTSSVTALTVTA